MKKMIYPLLICVFFGGPLSGQESGAQSIVKHVNDLINQNSMYAKMRMTIVTTSGEKRTFEYDSWSKDAGEKNLVRYTEPARVRDQAILMLNNADDIWAYFPRTRRVRKLATHAKKQKMQGSDLTYEDMGSGNAFIKDFSSRRLEDQEIQDHDCFVIELTRKPESSSHYSRLILYVIKDNYFPVVIDYYNEDDPTLWEKRMIQKDIREIEGIPTGMTIIMENKRDNTQTSMEILECRYNIELDDSMFSERGLKQ